MFDNSYKTKAEQDDIRNEVKKLVQDIENISCNNDLSLFWKNIYIGMSSNN